MTKTDPLAARRGGLILLRRSLEEGEPLDERALPDATPPQARARALTLARETMRWLGPIDALLASFVKRPPDDAGRAILRVAATELIILGEAPHGVVDAAVRIAKSSKETQSVSGLINAVLRRVSTEGPEIWKGLDHPRLATPHWLWRDLRADWGKADARAIAAAHLEGAPIDLTPKDGDAEALAVRLDAGAAPTGSVRLDPRGRLTALPGYEEGDWWAQDAAAAVPARLAGAGDGRRALDLCAAPGGKTMQLAAAGWAVTALDGSERRMRRVTENLARTGLAAEIVVADALEWRADAPFDLVLLDAPCTATGTIRRHPELPHIRDGAGLAEATARQTAMIDAAWESVAPGGVLIYCVCSLNRAEGERQVAAFLDRAPDAARDPITAEEIGDERLLTHRGEFRARPDIWADEGGLDGFFAARLRRNA